MEKHVTRFKCFATLSWLLGPSLVLWRSALSALRSIFWKEHDLYGKGLQWLKFWGMIVHRLKVKTCRVL